MNLRFTTFFLFGVVLSVMASGCERSLDVEILFWDSRVTCGPDTSLPCDPNEPEGWRGIPRTHVWVQENGGPNLDDAYTDDEGRVTLSWSVGSSSEYQEVLLKLRLENPEYRTRTNDDQQILLVNATLIKYDGSNDDQEFFWEMHGIGTELMRQANIHASVGNYYAFLEDENIDVARYAATQHGLLRCRSEIT